MRTGKGAIGKMGLILRDSDHTSEVSHNWKRVNTLKHYGVTKQVFKLVPRHQKPHGGQVFDYIGSLIYDSSYPNQNKITNTVTNDDKIW
ncbi:hypothetical protein, partial [Salmonella sp. s51228]|uniref:hypothetical protein n=1 Tax=Salmonella sp. s51228 TaxID=3159652 RepID=UPI00398035FF